MQNRKMPKFEFCKRKIMVTYVLNNFNHETADIQI